mmetsp:Transcript_26794/g.39640  ORF Transcript_26794/g.39640 Transcript_26794/m.39640 type:complete len:431 (+) Transcript_26794:79-1371(+)|eukprot:CAMPEP_0194206204 /NCGR_PEP_ID=MMETSP0156-20130528/5294_1 /TAXON_ID=33649 /ORGANISM="Thalassionema nitzschioides, Strain L26-B" /LENGTH=430 /DNA_ID=CAMNT_0038932661 /DNA_START=49 /DNA_END=1341 /DNA_ORIENTATION=+
MNSSSSSRRYNAIAGKLALTILLLSVFVMTTFLVTSHQPLQQQPHRRLVQLNGKGRVGSIRARTTRSNIQVSLRNKHHEPSKLHRRKEEARAALRAGDDNLHSNSTLKKTPLTIYSIFAGRPEPLEIQMPYIQELLNEEIIDEVHIWDYTCKQYALPKFKGKDKIKMNQEERLPTPAALEAARFLRETLLEIDPRIFLITPTQCVWDEYYRSYERLMRDSDVLIKADDDILFVDTHRVRDFVKTVRKFPEVFLWSANVINNGISAGLQKNDGLLPLHVVDMKIEVNNPVTEHCLFRQADYGREIHHKFLRNPMSFLTPLPGKELRLIRSRLSINFVAFLGKNMDRVATYVEKAEDDDELGLTRHASEGWKKEKLVVYMPLVVSHASFGPQHIGPDMYELYRNNAERLKSSKRADEWKMPQEFQLPIRHNV